MSLGRMTYTVQSGVTVGIAQMSSVRITDTGLNA